MKKTTLGCLAVLAVLILVVLVAGGYLVSLYNGLVASSQAVDAQWAQVENVYQRRADLVPNLVNTVKGAADFERGTLTAVVEARSRVGQLNVGKDLVDNPQRFAEFQAAQDQLSSALSRLLVVVERYPDLRSVAAFRDLMTQLEGTENRIAVERRRFNEVARDFNTRINQFPARLVAGAMGFHEKAYFTAQPGSETVPKVQF